MIIYLDFDGTVVEHKFPEIGQYNDGAFEVIQKLQNAGHDIILNTYRSDINDKTLEDSIDYCNDSNHFKLDGCTESKIFPKNFDIDSFIKEGVIFIDDMCGYIPLKTLDTSYVVDWYKLDEIFKSKGVYE